MKVYEFKPLVEGSYLRYDNGHWTETNGKEWDIAFIKGSQFYYFTPSYHENILWSWCVNMQWMTSVPSHQRGDPWHYMLKPGTTDWGNGRYDTQNPNYVASELARDYCVKLHSCASGSGPEMNIEDPYIKKGYLRDRETKEIVTIPETFICMYCGELPIIEVEK